MKSCSLLLALCLVVFLPGCKSEIDEKPAAEVTETTATTVTETASTGTPADAVRKNVVKEKSKIEFVGAKVTGDHHGSFKTFDGWIEYVGGKPSLISFEIDPSSVETDTEKLTEHLKSPDFFDVAKFTEVTFLSTSIAEAPAGSANGATHIVKGALDLHGVTKEVTIPVKAEVTPDGVRTTSEFTINRHDWGISYKGAADDLIKDNVLIKLDLVFPPAA
jgi:polyisoprenoid-binding protein YceI